jgi:hypothetical protein
MVFLKLLLDAMDDFEGKKVTKRIETYLQKTFPDYRVRYIGENSTFSHNIQRTAFTFSQHDREKGHFAIVHTVHTYDWRELKTDNLWIREDIWNYNKNFGEYAYCRLKTYKNWFDNKKEDLDFVETIPGRIEKLQNEINELKFQKSEYERIFAEEVLKEINRD